MTSSAASEGYAGASIANVIARAGVSRPTFYEYFSDRDACFLAALQEHGERMLARTRRAVAEARAEQALQAALGALVDFAAGGGEDAQFVLVQALAGGPRAADMRERGLALIAETVEARYRPLGSEVPVPDLCAASAIGGVQRLLASTLRRGAAVPAGLSGELGAWAGSYAAPLAVHRWREMKPDCAAPALPALAPMVAPVPLPPGRPRLSRSQVEENHRQRILFAAAEACSLAGYRGVRIGQVTRAAGVDNRVFHSLFKDKGELFAAVHEMHFQHLMATCASAFFGAEDWPERVWQAGLAFAACLQQNVSLARVSFVEGYAGDPVALERVEAVVRAFQVFFQDGFRESRGAGRHPTAVTVQAVTATIFEIAYQRSRHSSPPQVAALLPHVTHLILTPFLGREAAESFIAERTRSGA
jgi:AcrR family transcriptional regulator